MSEGRAEDADDRDIGFGVLGGIGAIAGGALLSTVPSAFRTLIAIRPGMSGADGSCTKCLWHGRALQN
jgi:hypothetical protein